MRNWQKTIFVRPRKWSRQINDKRVVTQAGGRSFYLLWRLTQAGDEFIEIAPHRQAICEGELSETGKRGRIQRKGRHDAASGRSVKLGGESIMLEMLVSPDAGGTVADRLDVGAKVWRARAAIADEEILAGTLAVQSFAHVIVVRDAIRAAAIVPRADLAGGFRVVSVVIVVEEHKQSHLLYRGR